MLIPPTHTQSAVHSEGLDGLHEKEEVQLPAVGQVPPHDGQREFPHSVAGLLLDVVATTAKVLCSAEL